MHYSLNRTNETGLLDGETITESFIVPFRLVRVFVRRRREPGDGSADSVEAVARPTSGGNAVQGFSGGEAAPGIRDRTQHVPALSHPAQDSRLRLQGRRGPEVPGRARVSTDPVCPRSGVDPGDYDRNGQSGELRPRHATDARHRAGRRGKQPAFHAGRDLAQTQGCRGPSLRRHGCSRGGSLSRNGDRRQARR